MIKATPFLTPSAAMATRTYEACVSRAGITTGAAMTTRHFCPSRKKAVPQHSPCWPAASSRFLQTTCRQLYGCAVVLTAHYHHRLMTYRPYVFLQLFYWCYFVVVLVFFVVWFGIILKRKNSAVKFSYSRRRRSRRSRSRRSRCSRRSRRRRFHPRSRRSRRFMTKSSTRQLLFQ